MTTIIIEVGYQDITGQSEAARARRFTPYATGHTWWNYPVDVDEVLSIDALGDAVFTADNSPHELPPDSLAGKIRAAMLTAYAATDVRHHSLSVGDRVRVSEVEVICTGNGWRRVHHAPTSTSQSI